MSNKVKARKVKSARAEWKLLHQEWFDESPRGVILTAAAFIDDRLRELISGYLMLNEGATKLFAGPTAPFGTFSSKIAASFALGLVSEHEYLAIDALRDIRNAFAHRVVVRFTDDDVSKHVTRFVSSYMKADWKPNAKKAEEDLMLHSRTTAFALIMDLVGKSTFIPVQRLKPVDWTELDGINLEG
jgi:DNA-binding MltR family transcriptional regulator